MKKLVNTAICVLCCSTIYALPVGNPSEASLYPDSLFTCRSYCDPCDPCSYWFDCWSLRTGFYGDYVFNRNLAIDGEGLGIGKTMRQTEIYTNAGYLALNIADKLDIFGTLGASTITLTSSEVSWVLARDGNSEGHFNWETAFSWSAGARGTLFSLGCFSLGVEGQYFQTNPDLTHYVTMADGRFTEFNENNEMCYKEWQVGAGISYQLAPCRSSVIWVPYAALKASWVKFDTNDFRFDKMQTLFPNPAPLELFDMKANKLWGYAIGMTATLSEMMGVTVEGRFGDEKAIYVNGQLRF